MMNINDLQELNVGFSLLKMVYQFIQLDKKTRYFGTDVLLHQSEIHMVNTIKENEGTHVTGLANILNITKGAVSQTIGKLEKKGLIIKDVSVENQSKVSLKLTEKGEVAYISHKEWHRQIDSIVNDIIKNDPEGEITYLKETLDKLERRLKDFSEEAKE